MRPDYHGVGAVMSLVDPELAARLHRRANAERWDVSVADFAAMLERSLARTGAGAVHGEAAAFDGLHLEDMALACACERGHDAAWEHFVREHRPGLYRAAAAIAAGEGRELADGLYGDLFGLRQHDGNRQSLFRYYSGRSRLATWLRAVLAQRHVDLVRAQRRLAPVPGDDEPGAFTVPPEAPSFEGRAQAGLVRRALEQAIARLAPRDRVRLGWYYAQGMTLAAIGRLCREHEATISRHLTRTRRQLRTDVEEQLREAGLAPGEIEESFAAAAADPGDADVRRLLDGAERKTSGTERSTIEERS